MRLIFGFFAAVTGVYSILILIRIILSWFSGYTSGKPVELLARVTDPYLDWWKKKIRLRIGYLDFSAVVAIAALSLAQSILYSIYASGRIYLGYVLAVILMSVWSVVSCITVFFMIIIILRWIAYASNRNIYSPFWRVIDTVSQPILYRLNRIIFGGRIGGFLKGMLISLLLLAVITIGGRVAVNMLAGLLFRLPV